MLRIPLKFVHIAGTFWLTGCAVFLLIVALRQAGARWWVIFSVGGFSGIAFLLLVSVYLFAVFRGVVRKQLSQEHPLTSSDFYLLFYDSTPFLGTLAGLISTKALAVTGAVQWLSLAAEGTFTMTFLVWIIGDPLLGLVETLLPSCAAVRRERLAAEAENRRQRQENRQRLLKQIQLSQQTEQEQWSQQLLLPAETFLTSLQQNATRDRVRHQALELGAYAWQQGGITCMQHLLALVNRLAREKGTPLPPLAFWWDGIGNWRRPSLKEALAQSSNNLF